jgi:UDP-3-O-[3-hydroxymyristoyl] N-acetylglucosamine deacetylase/3-hydroxyacyl-[acyl-carrier-protein] dehydratase
MRYLLLDRITEMSNTSAVGVKTCSLSEDYLAHHFRHLPIMPGVLVLESMVQLAGWTVWRSSKRSQWPVLQEVNSIKFLSGVRPGDQMKVQVELYSTDNGFLVKGSTTVLEQCNCKASFSLTPVAATELDESRELELLYQSLTREIYTL